MCIIVTNSQHADQWLSEGRASFETSSQTSVRHLQPQIVLLRSGLTPLQLASVAAEQIASLSSVSAPVCRPLVDAHVTEPQHCQFATPPPALSSSPSLCHAHIALGWTNQSGPMELPASWSIRGKKFKRTRGKKEEKKERMFAMQIIKGAPAFYKDLLFICASVYMYVTTTFPVISKGLFTIPYISTRLKPKSMSACRRRCVCVFFRPLQCVQWLRMYESGYKTNTTV